MENFPEKYGKPLRAPLAGYWEMYFENKFRIFYRIDQENRIVSIEAIKHKDEL